jgi:oligopeptide transport system substrate-binding protein
MVWRDMPSLDPTLAGYSLIAPLANQLFSGLVAFGPESEILPDVAYRWEIEAEGRRYVFHLRDDVFWSDGQPVTAHDFAFTYLRALDPATGARIASQLLYPVRGAREYHQGEHGDAGRVGIRALDEHTLILELEEATTYFIQNLAYYVMLPTPRHAVLANGEGWATPGKIVTNGPFRCAAWEPGRQMLLERNPRFHGSFGGNVEQVQLALGEAADSEATLYAAGELDVVLQWFGGLETIDELRRRFPAEHVRRQSFATTFSCVNVTRPPFDDKRLRQALAMAVDRHALAEGPMKGYVTPATGGFVPTGMPGHLPGCALGYDPEEARRLLAQSSFSAGERLTLVSPWSRERMSRFLQDTWQRILGLEVGVDLVAPEQLLEQIARPGANIGSSGWMADYPDPDNFLRVCIDVTTDLPESRRAEYNALLERATHIADQAERLRLYQQADHLLTEEAAIVPLYYVPFHLMLKPWVKRYPTAAVKNFGFWKDVVLEPEAGG